MDIRQSEEYVNYLRALSWKVESRGKNHIFIKKLPLGSLIKVQRIAPPIPFEEIEKLAEKYRAFQVFIEPAQGEIKKSKTWGYKTAGSFFIPTKTLIKSLKGTEKEIFSSFAKNKKRDIRLAEKKGLLVKQKGIEEFIRLKNQYLIKKFILPLGAGKDLRRLYRAFGQKAKVLIAYKNEKPLAGVLLLICRQTAYYWQAAATNEGKKLLAPTLLVWEAVKLAKKEGCLVFDFEGIADSRFTQQKSWQGFTHFKKGFRGEEVSYPLPLIKTRLRRLVCIRKNCSVFPE